jgi:GWxTD domain-containing protein
MFRKVYFFTIVLFLLIPALSISREKSDKGQDLLEKHRKWIEEDVIYIITPTEKSVFFQLETDKEREIFIEAFWKHRDPTLGTPVNEYKTEHYRRITYTNANFGRNAPGPGWKTDRGRTYIVLGKSNDVERYIGEQGIYNTEVWFYQGLTQFGLPSGFSLVFFQKDGMGEYVLYSPTANGPQALMQNYFGGSTDYIRAFRALKKISPRLAGVSMSLIAGEPSTSGQPSLSSDMLIQQIYTVPEKQFKGKYAEKFLLYKDIVEVEYTANYIDSDFLVRVIREPSGHHFVHYIIELKRFSIEQYQNTYVTHLNINGVVSDLEGKTIYQFERSIPVEFDKEQLKNITYRPFAFYDLFPMIPGIFRLSVLLKNEVSKEFTSIEKDIFIPERITSPQMSPLILGYKTHFDRTENMEPFKFASQHIYCQPMRIFLPQDRLFVSFQVLGLNQELTQNVDLKFEIRKETELMLTSEKKLSEYPDRMNILEHFPLQDLSPGYYQVAVHLVEDNNILLSESERFEITPTAGLPRPWTQASSLSPLSNPAYSLIIGRQYFNNGKIEKARIELERAHQNQPDSQEISSQLANVYFIFQKYEKSKQILLPFTESEDAKYKVLFLLGKTHQALGEYDKAIFLFDKAINRFGINVFLLNSLGECYFNLRKFKEALVAWEKSLEIKPDQSRIKEKVESIRMKKIS